MFQIVLVHPQIPPNTGNVIRLAANTGCRLHLIEPLGFSMEDRLMRRAGLDYHEYVDVMRHPTWEIFLETQKPDPQRSFALTTRGQILVQDAVFKRGDWLFFGSETAGLPENVRAFFSPDNCIRLPMIPEQRSLNLSNAVAVVVYEAWRQSGFSEGV
jgi:tRNA (cytidine/uridine-2'-O-)-methyltransferase